MSAARDAAETPVVVFAHVHYPDVWERMAALLAERLREPFRLVITTSRADACFALPDTPHLLSHEIRRGENRGRDVRPFLAAFAETPDFTVGLKLHTKRSDHRLDGEAWRDDLIGSLLPPAGGTGRIVAAMRENTRLGMVAPDGALLRLEPWILRNMKGLKRAGAATGIAIDPPTIATARFVAGSMFWFRREAVAGVVVPELQDMFEPEKGQVDGTLAHALERLFGVEAERRGFLLAPARAVAAAGALVDEEALRRAASAEAPNPYLREQLRGLQLIDRYLPVAKTIYRSLPVPVRRALRRVLTGQP